MDTTCPIKEMKIRSSQIKFIIKTFTWACVAKILPKLRLQDQQLWDILSSTNTNLHAHDVVGSLWVWTPILSISLSSSYIQSRKRKFHIFFSSQKVIILNSCFHYSSSSFALKGHVWISLFICSSFKSCSCCSKFEIVFSGPYLHQVSIVCFIISQLYHHNLCPCNVDLCCSTLPYVLA
jgi:hypothetical protein